MVIKQRPTQTNLTDRFFEALDRLIEAHMPLWFSKTWLMKEGGLVTPKGDTRWFTIPLMIISGLATIILLILRFQ